MDVTFTLHITAENLVDQWELDLREMTLAQYIEWLLSQDGLLAFARDHIEVADACEIQITALEVTIDR